MENQVTDTVLANDLRGQYTPEATELHELAEAAAARPGEQRGELLSLRIPVGTNLADVERWMIFATLQKCGGNKTRAAALLGVSLKTLYNRLNAYRAHGLVMDYEGSVEGRTEGDGHGSRDDAPGRGSEMRREFT